MVFCNTFRVNLVSANTFNVDVNVISVPLSVYLLLHQSIFCLDVILSMYIDDKKIR